MHTHNSRTVEKHYPDILSGFVADGWDSGEDRIYRFILFWVSQLFHTEYILLI